MTVRAASVAASVRSILAGLSLSIAASAGASGTATAAENWPANMRAVYDINFNGFNVGSFEFHSQAERQSYTLLGNAKLSVLLGAFSWDAETRSFGLLVNQAPKPASFTFDYKSNLRNGSTKLGFANGAVTDISHLPPEMPRPDTVPLREQHLKGVVDPLSAIMMLARGSSANPCDRRIPIFDGKERFDLVFSYKGERKVVEQVPRALHADRRPQGRQRDELHGGQQRDRDCIASRAERQRAHSLSGEHSDHGGLGHHRLQARRDRLAGQAADRAAALTGCRTFSRR